MKIIIGWASGVFLLSAVAMYLLGASIGYSLLSGLIAVLAVVAFFSMIALPYLAGMWVTARIAPKDSAPTCLVEAIWLRAIAIREQSKNTNTQTPSL